MPKPTPPSREAEIAATEMLDNVARMAQFMDGAHGWAVQLEDARHLLQPLIAQLQQARQERDKFEQQRDAAETTLSQVWIRAEIAEAALQQAREALIEEVFNILKDEGR